MKRNKLFGMVLVAVTVLSLALTACGNSASESSGKSAKTEKTETSKSADKKTSESTEMWDDLPEGEAPEGYVDDDGYIYGDVEGIPEAAPDSEANEGNVQTPGGEYSLEYELTSGWRMDGDEKITYYLDGSVVRAGEDDSYLQLEWYNEHRPFVYAMFFPNLNGERVCQLYLDFATYEIDDEIFVNLPYDSPNGTFDNDNAIHYDEGGAIDNGGNIRISFPITVSGLGGGTLDIMDGIDGMHYVFTLKAERR